ncbi:hypothetical protein TNCV_2017551, partial [Trichonephila clavipes]
NGGGPSALRGAPGEDPLKWLKKYDRVANFNKWDDMMCAWLTFISFLTELRENYLMLPTKCIRTLPKGKNPLMKEDEKVSHLMKGVAEDIYQALLTKKSTTQQFYQMVQLYRRYEAERELVDRDLKGFQTSYRLHP